METMEAIPISPESMRYMDPGFNPQFIFAPFMPSHTLEHQYYVSWENKMIAQHLLGEADPQFHDTDEIKDEFRLKLRKYNERIRGSLSDPSQLQQSGAHRNESRSLLADAVCKSRIFAARLFPVNELPSELLGEILALVVGDGTTSQRLIVTWVCRRWRETAISQPRLWRYIRFNDVCS
jgi:hypothetical protein